MKNNRWFVLSFTMVLFNLCLTKKLKTYLQNLVFLLFFTMFFDLGPETSWFHPGILLILGGFSLICLTTLVLFLIRDQAGAFCGFCIPNRREATVPPQRRPEESSSCGATRSQQPTGIRATGANVLGADSHRTRSRQLTVSIYRRIIAGNCRLAKVAQPWLHVISGAC